MTPWYVLGARSFEPPLNIRAGDEITAWVNPASGQVRVHNVTTDTWHVPINPTQDSVARE